MFARPKEYEILKLGFDIDGVISDFVGYFAKVVGRHYGLSLVETDFYCYDLDLILGITKEQRNRFITTGLFRNLEPVPGAKTALRKLKSEGHDIFILTSRGEHLTKVTKDWLRNNEIPYSRLMTLNGGEKHLADVDLDLVVEDNLAEAIGLTKRFEVLLFDRPWNRSLNAERLFKRVHSWNEITKEVNMHAYNFSP